MLAFKTEEKSVAFEKANKLVHVGLTEDEYRAFMEAKGELSLSEAARQIVEHYSEREHTPHRINFWISADKYAELQARAQKAGKQFYPYINQLFHDFFRDRGNK